MIDGQLLVPQFILQEVQDIATLEGETATYDVTLRVRGVVETSPYDGGVDLGPVHQDGGPTSGFNTFALQVSEPPHTYWLNVGNADFWTFGVDYTFTLPVADGATLRVYGNSGGDSCGLRNLDEFGVPTVVPDIPPAPAPAEGQFLQLDVVDIQLPG